MSMSVLAAADITLSLSTIVLRYMEALQRTNTIIAAAQAENRAFTPAETKELVKAQRLAVAEWQALAPEGHRFVSPEDQQDPA